MKRSRKSYRVSWAPGLNLCQVKLFLSEDCPSKVGQKIQDHLQAKTSWMLQSHDIPPGFEGNKNQNKSKEEVSVIPWIKWRCPPRFMLSHNWHVAAGEESEEKDVQKLREMRVLEAVYPRHSSIPQSPSVSMEAEDKHCDDSVVPIIPIIPIEEEESMDVNSDVEGGVKFPVSVPPEFFAHDKAAAARISSTISNVVHSGEPGVSPDLNADVIAAASAALAAIMKCNEQGSMIDTDLLIKILTDQKMSERLINEHARVATTEIAPMSKVGDPTLGLKNSSQAVQLSGATTDAHKPISQNMVGMPSSNSITKSATPVIHSSTCTTNVHRPLHQNAVTAVLPTSSQKSCSVVPSSAPKIDVNMQMNQNTGSLSSLSSKPTPLPVLPSSGRLDMNEYVIQNVHHLPQRVMNLQPPAIGVKRVASVAFPASCAEQSAVLPPISIRNLHSVANPMQPGTNPVPNPAMTGSVPSAMNGSVSVKDANYYKNLIREHGMDRQEIMKPPEVGNPQSNVQELKMIHSIKAGGVKPKYQKPCMYFNTTKGCRNGLHCPFMHDTGCQLPPGGSVGFEGTKRLRP